MYTLVCAMDGEQDTRVCEESTSFGTSESSEHSLKLSQVKNGHKIQFKWLGDLFELKSFIAEELKVLRKWTHTDNNGGFDTLKSDGVSISFYPGTKTLNVQRAKMEIIRKKLLDLSKTSNISDSYESLEDSSLEVDEQRENYHQSEIKPSAEGDEAEYGHCHRKYLSDHGKVDVVTSTFSPSPQTLEWFKSYLSNRFQVVFINGVLSEHEQIKCGVPQGSILGPLLFMIFLVL